MQATTLITLNTVNESSGKKLAFQLLHISFHVLESPLPPKKMMFKNYNPKYTYNLHICKGIFCCPFFLSKRQISSHLLQAVEMLEVCDFTKKSPDEDINMKNPMV